MQAWEVVPGARLTVTDAQVAWIEADVTGDWTWSPATVWHDRALFHFLTEPADRLTYRTRLDAVLKPGGLALIATFALDGGATVGGRFTPSVGYFLSGGANRTDRYLDPPTVDNFHNSGDARREVSDKKWVSDIQAYKDARAEGIMPGGTTRKAVDEARKAFKTALEKTEIKNPARQLIQLKLDALGGNAASAG